MNDGGPTFSLTVEQIDRFRQWYNALQDVSPKYLEPADHELGALVSKAVDLGADWTIKAAARGKR